MACATVLRSAQATIAAAQHVAVREAAARCPAYGAAVNGIVVFAPLIS